MPSNLEKNQGQPLKDLGNINNRSHEMSNKIYYYENINQVLKLKLPETFFFFIIKHRSDF